MPNPLYDALFQPHAGSEKPFLVLKDGQTISYRAFLKMADGIGTSLLASGAAPGERVAVQVAKSPQALALYAACVKIGAVFLPLNTAYTPNEVRYFVTDASPKVVVGDPKVADELGAIANECDATLLTLGADGSGSLIPRATQIREVEIADRSGDDLAAILYTSGTTGRSKGAMLSQNNLLSNAKVLVDYWRFTADDALLHALPIFHTHGLFVASNVMLLAGGSMIFLPSFNQDDMIALLPRSTSMMGVPTFYTRLLDDERFDGDLTKHMRLFISGSAPLLAETHVEFEERTGHRILERYGMTETNMNTSNPYDGERKAGTVGLPLPGTEVRIADPDTGNGIEPGAVGSIEIRGANVFSGYWNMPEKTAEEFRENGFFISGDLGTQDEDGYISIVGRAKDLIISGGYNIYPKEVELVIDEIEGVKESAVVGVPHPDFGEGVVALVVPEPEGTVTSEAIAAALKDNIARFKQPKHIAFTDALPRNTMGKVQKNIIRDEFGGLFQR
ncbi:MAG: malonyl-CoA synthase [Pseudomonadota bacterium]